jgi:hypothetical protein
MKRSKTKVRPWKERSYKADQKIELNLLQYNLAETCHVRGIQQNIALAMR